MLGAENGATRDDQPGLNVSLGALRPRPLASFAYCLIVRCGLNSLTTVGGSLVFDINEHSVVWLIGPGRLVFIGPDFVVVVHCSAPQLLSQHHTRKGRMRLCPTIARAKPPLAGAGPNRISFKTCSTMSLPIAICSSGGRPFVASAIFSASARLAADASGRARTRRKP